MGKEVKAITAKEARDLADNSEFTLKHIYKYIRERAFENATILDWSICFISKGCIEHIADTLKKDGYTVEVSDCSLIIKW